MVYLMIEKSHDLLYTLNSIFVPKRNRKEDSIWGTYAQQLFILFPLGCIIRQTISFHLTIWAASLVWNFIGALFWFEGHQQPHFSLFRTDER